MKTLKYTFVYSLLGFSLLGLGTACSEQQQEQKSTAEKKQPLQLATDSIRWMQPNYSLSLPGELKPYEEVQVYAKVNGFVQKLLVDRGTYVHKNQLLALLEAPEMGQQHLSDKAAQEKMHSDYRFAEQAYARLKEASATPGAVSSIEVERAHSALMRAKSAFEASKASASRSAQLQQYLQIVAPFAGRISQRNVSVGALVGPGGTNTALFHIRQDDKLRLTISIPEKHAASIPEDLTASFTVSSLPGETFMAKLSRSAGGIDTDHRSLTLEFDVDNSQYKLQGGEYAQVNLQLKRKTGSFWVPQSSVVKAPSGSFIMQLANQSLHRIPVKEGLQLDSLVEVFGNIQNDMLILRKASEEIKEGKLNNE